MLTIILSNYLKGWAGNECRPKVQLKKFFSKFHGRTKFTGRSCAQFPIMVFCFRRSFIILFLIFKFFDSFPNTLGVDSTFGVNPTFVHSKTKVWISLGYFPTDSDRPGRVPARALASERKPFSSPGIPPCCNSCHANLTSSKNPFSSDKKSNPFSLREKKK